MGRLPPEVVATPLYSTSMADNGVLQIVSVSLLLSSVTFEVVGISQITMAMILLSSWVIGATVSPVAPLSIAVSSLLKESIYKIIVKWNWLYVILITCVHSIVIYVVHLLLS